jgi:hypothetical protein
MQAKTTTMRTTVCQIFINFPSLAFAEADRKVAGEKAAHQNPGTRRSRYAGLVMAGMESTLYKKVVIRNWSSQHVCDASSFLTMTIGDYSAIAPMCLEWEHGENPLPKPIAFRWLTSNEEEEGTKIN